jgi:hypothetical protein
MTVRRLDDATITLEGACPIEDAERLTQHLLAEPGSTVDWRACDSAHTAVVQVLMASGAKLAGPPRGTFLANFVAPLIGNNQT